MGFTSGLVDADSNDQHSVKIKLTNGETGTSDLPDLLGDDHLMHKGDLWKLSFENDFSFTSCVTKNDIQFIRIKAHGNDDWNIETIVTFVKSGNDYELATSDFEVNRWIDSDGVTAHRNFQLHLVL